VDYTQEDVLEPPGGDIVMKDRETVLDAKIPRMVSRISIQPNANSRMEDMASFFAGKTNLY
jgi:hypothetical protein